MDSSLNKDTYPDYLWDKIPTGSIFTAKIRGVKCHGRIFKERNDYIYLCNNNISNQYMVSRCPNRLGYKYALDLNNTRSQGLYDRNIKNLRVYLPEEGYKIPVEKNYIQEYKLTIYPNVITAGCTTVLFEQIEYIYNKMLKLRKKTSK